MDESACSSPMISGRRRSFSAFADLSRCATALHLVRKPPVPTCQATSLCTCRYQANDGGLRLTRCRDDRRASAGRAAPAVNAELQTGGNLFRKSEAYARGRCRCHSLYLPRTAPMTPCARSWSRPGKHSAGWRVSSSMISLCPSTRWGQQDGGLAFDLRQLNTTARKVIESAMRRSSYDRRRRNPGWLPETVGPPLVPSPTAPRWGHSPPGFGHYTRKFLVENGPARSVTLTSAGHCSANDAPATPTASIGLQVRRPRSTGRRRHQRGTPICTRGRTSAECSANTCTSTDTIDTARGLVMVSWHADRVRFNAPTRCWRRWSPTMMPHRTSPLNDWEMDVEMLPSTGSSTSMGKLAAVPQFETHRRWVAKMGFAAQVVRDTTPEQQRPAGKQTPVTK